MAAPFRLYSTLSRKTEPFEPGSPGKVSLYCCGMTVSGNVHVGHARAFIVFDAFVRYLRHRGWEVRFVRNFTDVDDKIINRAQELGEDPAALAQRLIDEFHRDVRALGLTEPDSEPRVTESMEQIKDMIAALVERGHAYPSEGSVWFDVTSFPEYGKLSGQKVEELRSADEVPGKRHAADFALWKAVKPGEPSWDSPWGPGRPGWHIECSAMVEAAFGKTVDIHGGGLDLVFPHHENEVAQSECANGASYARYWMHNGLLTMAGGQKMGKSLGNVIDVHDALRDYPAEAMRLYYLQNHYRSPLPWGETALIDALGMLARLYEAREKAEEMGGAEDPQRVAADLGEDAAKILELAEGFSERFYAALDDDFNSAQALGPVFEMARAVNRLANHKKAKKRAGPVVSGALQAFALVHEALGFLGMTSSDFQEEVKTKRLAAMNLTRADIEKQLAERQAAREAKDWARSDGIRDELAAQGILVMDTAEGMAWRIAL
jgi:cysteinyl-tRNA synthetase